MPGSFTSLDRVPVELYREIVSYVEARTDLLSLSMTSRAMGYEAERILYRKLRFGEDGEDMLPTHFQRCRRIHSHVRSLYYTIRTGLEARNASKILGSVKNLKTLILYSYSPLSHVLPTSPPFQLHELEAVHVPDFFFKAFLQSQRELCVIRWNPRGLLSLAFPLPIPFTPQDLPALRVVELYEPLVELLLPSRPIRCLRILEYFDLRIEKLQPISTVYALQFNYLGEADLIRVAELFPNLQFLEVLYPDEAVILSIHLFTNLKILRLRELFNLDEAAAIFERNDVVDVIEYAHDDYEWDDVVDVESWQVNRGLDHKPVTLDPNEWRKV